MKDKKQLKKIIFLIVILVLLLPIFIFTIYSKYRTNISGSASVQVAKPVINISNFYSTNATITNGSKNLVYIFKVSNYDTNKVSEVKQSYKLKFSGLNNSSNIDQLQYSIYKTTSSSIANQVAQSTNPSQTITNNKLAEITMQNNEFKTEEVLTAGTKQDNYYIFLLKSTSTTKDVSDSLKVQLISKQIQ